MGGGWSLPPRRNRVAVEYDVEVPMSNGTVLLATHYIPVSVASAATVLVRCPYGRTGVFALQTGQILAERGPKGLADWVLRQGRPLLTDTTLRDAHQSLLATRMRSYDILRIAPLTAHLAPELFSLECWGGATFDTAYRFLNEDPWARLRKLNEGFRTPGLVIPVLGTVISVASFFCLDRFQFLHHRVHPTAFQFRERL